MPAAGAGVGAPATKPGVPRLGSTAQTAVPDEVAQNPATQEKPATVDAPIHALPTVGVIQVAPSQYSDPDTLPGPMHAMPKVAVPAPGVQVPNVQVKPPTVDDPTHAVLAAGVLQIAPSQYRDPDTLPVPVHAPPAAGVAPPEQ